MLVGDAWGRLQEHSRECSPGWVRLKSEALEPTGRFASLDVRWQEGLLVPSDYEQSVALYVAHVKLFVMADSGGLPTTRIDADAELVPVVSAKGVVLLTTSRVTARLSEGHFVKMPLEPSELVLVLQRQELIWLEADADMSWRGAGHLVVLVRGDRSCGAVALSITHLVNRHTDRPEHRFVPVRSRDFCASIGAEPHVGTRVKTRSGTVRAFEIDSSREVKEFALRVRAAATTPWRRLP